MKKLLFVFAIATSFVACNNAAETTEAKVDSTVSGAVETVTATVDSASAKIDSTVKLLLIQLLQKLIA